jgi:hypothetical protein
LKPIAALFTHELPLYSNDTTEQLGTKALDESDKALHDAAVDKYMVKTDERKRIVIDMPIDIEMAHYRGYDGIPVYEQNENGEKWDIGCMRSRGKGSGKLYQDKETKTLTSLKSQFSNIQQVFI